MLRIAGQLVTDPMTRGGYYKVDVKQLASGECKATIEGLGVVLVKQGIFAWTIVNVEFPVCMSISKEVSR